MAIVVIDIGGTNFRIGAVDRENRLEKFEKVSTKSVFATADLLRDLAGKILDFAQDISVEAVAIGFPATIDADRKRVLQAPNVPFMENLPVCDYLQGKLGVPILIERDVTYTFYYDMQKYQIPDRGIVCGVYFGTGIGNVISIDGKPLTGCHGTAGELGHIPVLGSDIVCGCGNVGCLEAVCGGKALARIRQERFPLTDVGDLFTRHNGEDCIRSFVDDMSAAVATEINILDPDWVLVGGGVVNMPDFPVKLLDECIRKRTRKPLPYRDLRLVYTEDESDKSVIGGAIYARRVIGQV